MPARIGLHPGGERRDRGASATEYTALLVLAGLIIVALLLLVPNPVQSGVRAAICTMFGGKDCGTSAPFEYKPPTSACLLSSNSKKVGGSVTIFSIKIGQNFQVVKMRTADGKVKVMVVPVDYKLGAEAEVGGKLQFGKGSFGGELGAKVEGSVNLKYGDTWVFKDDKEASDFIDKMKWDVLHKEGEKLSPGLWLWDKATGWKPKARDPDISQVEVGVEGVLKGTAGFGNLTTGSDGKKKVTDIGTGAEVEGKAGDAVIVTTDKSGAAKDGFPKTSYTFQVKGSYKLGAKVIGYGPGGERSYTGQTKVTYDKDGRLLSVTWITTQEENASEGFKNPGKNNGSVKGTDKKVSVTTTTLNFDDSNRALGEKWIHDNAFLMPLQTVRNTFDQDGPLVTRDPGPGGDPFDKLIYDRGVVSRNTYAGDVDEFKIAAEIAAELKFGIEGGYEGEKQTLVGSQYLGAPQNGQRTFQDWPECTTG
ncbi:hypothetical protein [Actinomadura parmotrematis]|uniref:Carboxypeptidase regulatory-like domain-containing protein n=1 Tax=Actinomadura parmotrematis TaxID=2864039 RepID=A0ABS7FZ72_9ACTN|nr:hypothetical protein [Actinomadura parmotrematis]MBW8484944.1 hypothetical protein [Actinomadura parmotrematis]